MPVRLFSLRNVPDDEAEEVRALLTKHAIDYYETPAGMWGISMPAIWLRDEAQFAHAKSLLDDYQRRRAEHARAAYAQLKSEGKQRTLIDALRADPLRFILYVSAAAALVYFSTKPFLDLGS